jgi:hypothetical protein
MVDPVPEQRRERQRLDEDFQQGLQLEAERERGVDRRQFARECQAGCVRQFRSGFLRLPPRGAVDDDTEDEGAFASLNGREAKLDRKLGMIGRTGRASSMNHPEVKPSPRRAARRRVIASNTAKSKAKEQF